MDDFWKAAAIMVAILAPLIAYQQFRVAREKLRMELFEKRYAVFTAVQVALSNVPREATYSLQQLYEYRAGIAQRHFLFGSDVLDFLDDVDRHLVKFLTNAMALKDLQHMPDRREDYQRKVDVDHDELLWLTDQLPQLVLRPINNFSY